MKNNDLYLSENVIYIFLNEIFDLKHILIWRSYWAVQINYLGFENGDKNVIDD